MESNMSQKEIKSFRDLDVWNAGMELVTTVYGLATKFPDSERFALSAQVRRSAVSIPSNVAEGHARRGRAYRNHVLIALGSTAELETQLEAAVRLKFLTSADMQAALDLMARVGQMLHGLERSLMRRNLAVLGSGFVSFCATALAFFHLIG
jgi:four helix bundle protein